MKSLYLILAAAAVAVTSEPQRADNDIIWYPVDDEEGVFISTFGEKRKTPHDPKWRSHRRARFTQLPLPLSYDPTDNQDPSFFHNIRDRRPSPLLDLSSSFHNQHTPPNPPDNTFQDIVNDVFDYRLPSANDPSTRWPTSPLPHQPPTQWSRPRPSTTERAHPEADKLVFPGQTSRPTTTPSALLPTDPPTMSPCERNCPVTPEFNPVCGSDAVTYSNAGRLKCAQLCGKNVRLSHHGNCGRTPLVTPLLSNNRKRKFTRFL